MERKHKDKNKEVTEYLVKHEDVVELLDQLYQLSHTMEDGTATQEQVEKFEELLVTLDKREKELLEMKPNHEIH